MNPQEVHGNSRIVILTCIVVTLFYDNTIYDAQFRTHCVGFEASWPTQICIMAVGFNAMLLLRKFELGPGGL